MKIKVNWALIECSGFSGIGASWCGEVVHVVNNKGLA